jgi:plasmid stability protein
MPNLNIRNVEEALLRWLRRRAAEHGHSMNQEVLDALAVLRADEAAERRADHPVARAYLKTRDRGIRSPATGARMIREDRDRDERRRR